ncbi:peptidylprolyl isomerase [Pyruvatibacter sp.]|uniref:peptidylprolyl isomerase n=1 Tax=Pyruvatibacter sp. TaxID=1981328 RepID=UPI0032ED6673
MTLLKDASRVRIAGAAVILGLVLGLWGALAQNPFAPWGGEQGIAATVNAAVVTADDVTLAIEAVAADKRNEMTQADRARILGRLIDEELLIQRGVEVGLVDSDNTVRKAIVNAMIVSVIDDAANMEPTEADLRQLYEESPALFSGVGRVQVKQIFVRNGPQSDQTLAAIREALNAGETFSSVRARYADPVTLPVPDGPLPYSKLRDYTGPTAATALSTLSKGEISDPLPVPGGQSVFKVVATLPGTPRPFADVRSLVEAEFIRRRGDAALRHYLDWLWSRAEIDFADGYAAEPEAHPQVIR